MKKVFMVAPPFHSIPPTKGAAVEWWIYQVSKRLKHFEPHIISICGSNEPELEIREGVTIHRVKIGRTYRRIFQKILGIDPLSYVRRVDRIIRRIGADIVHVHNMPAMFLELENLGKKRTRHYVLHMHNGKPEPHLTSSSELFVVSQYLANYYRTFVPQANIQIIPNGVDIDQIRPKWELQGKPNFRDLNNRIPPGSKVILYAGRMSPEKGPLKLVRAFAELLKSRSDVFLLMAGEFTTRKNNDRTAYGIMVRSACEKIGDACLLLGIVSPNEIQNVYHHADLVVMPSDFEEPFGMVAIEAMAAGVPVMVAKKGGLVEFIEDRKTGMFIRQPDDPLAFSDQLNEVLNNDRLLTEVPQNARQQVENCFTWEIVAKRTEEAFASVMN